MDKFFAKFVIALQTVLGDRDKDRGATATEYALLVALIAIVIAVAVGFFGSQLSDFFHGIGTTVASWT
jgi:pilus assembly protein Flp/PilA